MSARPLKVFVPCDSAARSVGADRIASAISLEAERLGVVLSVVRTGSRGLLWLEPMVEVETPTGRIAYGPVAPSDVASLFQAGFTHGGLHALRLGEPGQIPFLANQERLLFSRCGVAGPLDLAAYEKGGGLTGLRTALKRSPSDVVSEIKASGLRGRGGAGFPTGRKWETVANTPADRRFICCNADEGDSGTFADRMLIEGDPFSLIEGMSIAAFAVGAEHGFVYIRSEYPDAISTMRAAVATWEAAGWHNLNGSLFRIEVRSGAGAYICGEESSMLQSLEGKRGEVRTKPPLPAVSGMFGEPTVVNNVLTFASVPWILANGGTAYAIYGVGQSRGTQAFQLGGDVARGGLVEKAFGVTLRELVEGFGGGTRSGRPIKAVMTGGPLGTYLSSADLDVAMDYESLQAAGGMLGHGGIVIFNDKTDMARLARFAMEFCAAESCGKCTPCRVGSIRGVETIDKILAGENAVENLRLLDDLCELMAEGSLCAMGGLTPSPVRSALERFPEDFHDRTNPNPSKVAP